MEVADFEQDILKLAFETDVRITTASVAYYLGIPSTKAGPMLEELLERGVLELDSDPDGNLYYRVADAARGDTDEISQLRHERLTGVDGGADGHELPGDEGEAHQRPWEVGSVGGATVDDVDGDEPISPNRRGPDRAEAYIAGTARTDDDGRRADASTDGRARESGEARGTVGRGPIVDRDRADHPRQTTEPAPARHEPTPPTRTEQADPDPERARQPGVVSASDDVFAGITRKRGAMDASLDTCGDEKVVVQSEARCEPRPLADSNPTVASCSDPNPSAKQQQTGLIQRRDDYSAIGHVREPQPSRSAGGGAAAASLTHQQRQTHLEKPEHQPGMSLLLSLILCGTGQIYNGEVSKGIMMMVLCFLLWFVLLGWVVHIWSIVDSVVVAERINRQSGNN